MLPPDRDAGASDGQAIGQIATARPNDCERQMCWCIVPCFLWGLSALTRAELAVSFVGFLWRVCRDVEVFAADHFERRFRRSDAAVLAHLHVFVNRLRKYQLASFEVERNS
jgi:hypothetical protein